MTCSSSSWNKSPAFRPQFKLDLHSEREIPSQLGDFESESPFEFSELFILNSACNRWMLKCGEYCIRMPWEPENTVSMGVSCRDLIIFSHLLLPISSVIFRMLNMHQVIPFGNHQVRGEGAARREELCRAVCLELSFGRSPVSLDK